MPDAVGIPPSAELDKARGRVRDPFNPSESRGCDSESRQESREYRRYHLVASIREEAGNGHSNDVSIPPPICGGWGADDLDAAVRHEDPMELEPSEPILPVASRRARRDHELLHLVRHSQSRRSRLSGRRGRGIDPPALQIEVAAHLKCGVPMSPASF